MHTYMLVQCILVQSCAYLLLALLNTPRATVTAYINNKVSDKKTGKLTYVGTVRLAQ